MEKLGNKSDEKRGGLTVICSLATDRVRASVALLLKRVLGRRRHDRFAIEFKPGLLLVKALGIFLLLAFVGVLQQRVNSVFGQAGEHALWRVLGNPRAVEEVLLVDGGFVLRVELVFGDHHFVEITVSHLLGVTRKLDLVGGRFP